MLKVSGDEFARNYSGSGDQLANIQNQPSQFKEPPVNADSEKLIPSVETVEKAIKQAEKVSTVFTQDLHFEYRKEADMYQVLVLKKSQKQGEEDKVIRKIPADEVVNFVEHLKDMFGALLDVKA